MLEDRGPHGDRWRQEALRGWVEEISMLRLPRIQGAADLLWFPILPSAKSWAGKWGSPTLLGVMQRCCPGILTQPPSLARLNRFSWRYQLREFQSRFHVVAVDLRGYGSSDAPKDVDCYTMDLLMADIQDVILGLGREVPPSQPWPPSPLPHHYLTSHLNSFL